ncbi:MAG: hypothetical protein V4689_06000 [Verrucomicrobiota bacterium]
MKTKSIITLIGISTFALAISSCDSKQEDVREERLEMKADNIEATADQLRKDGEKAADMKEENAGAIRKSSENAADATEDSADATRKAVEKRADQLEDAADSVRKQK